MIIERTEHPDWLSNAYLVYDEPGGTGVFIDGNDNVEPLIQAARDNDLQIAAVLLTHHHHDHLAGLERLSEEFGAPILAHELTAREVDGVDRTLVRRRDGELRRARGAVALFTPGHAPGHLAFLVNEHRRVHRRRALQGHRGRDPRAGRDRLRGPQGVRGAAARRCRRRPHPPRPHAPHDRRRGAREQPVLPHLERRDPEGDEECTVRGEPARLVLWAPDYDGTNKAWVRFGNGEDAIVGGSQVSH